MQRLKLTTTKGKVFLSPFAYSDQTAQIKLKKMAWLIQNDMGKVRKGASLVLVKVDKYPKLALYGKNDELRRGKALLRRLTLIEAAWDLQASRSIH